ncbi:MAG: ATP synthase F1 subunit gamma, partial [Muribaculaceae bacterium]|nr:ATP synthase F1 subunit gamma [Muribaculaceae bacterium]
ELKGRIGSVASSEKITGAMKMISSAKMHKAENSLKRLVPFKSQIETIMANLLSSDADFSSPLVTPRDVRSLTLVVWGSDDGLCGAYNVNIFKNLVERIKELKQQVPEASISVIAVGKKMYKAASRLSTLMGIEVSQAQTVDSKSDGKPVDDFMLSLQSEFLSGRIDRADALYMHFKSAGKQIPTARQLLPVLPEIFSTGNDKAVTGRPYLFEPDPNSIFNAVLPMFLMSTMQEIFTENRASEQAARVMAMQSANDNAKTLLEQLNLEYNKLRQQSITNELLDIVGGQVRD